MKPNLETTLKALDLFGKLDLEKKVEIIKPKVKRNETLDLIIEKYKEGLEKFGLYDEGKLKIKIPEGEYCGYYIAKSSAPSKISSDNITEFSLLLEEHENKNYFGVFTGWYLNALINRSKDKDFKIFTNYLSKTIHYIGYKNRKNIVVNGNAGWGVGGGMKDGKITVSGNAGDEVGFFMENGKITINGNVGNSVGYNMKDGEITINGNTGRRVGWDMKDGKIHLNGDYKSLGDFILGGNIYHKGKLIVENGKRL